MKKTSKTYSLVLFSAILLVLLVSFVSASLESDFFTLMNAERGNLGKQSLYPNSNLTQAAYLHAKDMGDNNYFSHTSLDGRTFVQRITNAGYIGYTTIGENLAYAYGGANATQVFNMWKNSPGHYTNMISDSFREAGLGVYSINGFTYYALDLGSRTSFQPNNTVNLANNTLPITNSTIPVINSTINFSINSLFNYTNLTVANGNYYKLIKILVKMNSKTSIYYKLDNNSEKKICTSCDKFTIYIQTKRNSNQIELIAKNNSGVIEKRLLNF